MSTVRRFWKPAVMMTLSGLVAILSACQPPKPITLQADLDKDGIEDTVIFDHVDHSFYFVRGSSVEKEKLHTMDEKLGKVTWMVVEDIDCDGSPDIKYGTERARSVPGLRVPFYEHKTQVLFSHGDGTFSYPVEQR